jgi:hypothetical protein
MAIPVVVGATAASAAPTAPTCTLDQSNIGIQSDTNPQGSISLIASDPTGIKGQISPYHINATTNINHHPGTTSAETTFTQNPAPWNVYQASGSLQITGNEGLKTICLGQFHSLTSGGHTEVSTLTVPSDRNMFTIANSSAKPLTAVAIQINQGCTLSLNLTPGEVFTTDMSNWEGTGINCLNGTPSSESDFFNTISVAGDPAGNVPPGTGFAEIVAWGTGPFVYSPLPE